MKQNEMTLNQAMRKGVEAHQSGKLKDAEALYQAVLKVMPNHSDANHNLAVLWLSEKNSKPALKLFKTAFEENPKQEKFWMSYVKALAVEKQFDNAMKIIKRGRKLGLSEDSADGLEEQINIINQGKKLETAKEKKDSIISDNHQKIIGKNRETNMSQKNKFKKDVLRRPPKSELNKLLKLYQSGRYKEAEKLALFFSEKFPYDNFSWKVLAGVLQQTGRISESLAANQMAVELGPQDFSAHGNLGVILEKVGRLKDAEISYKEAVRLKPDFVEGHFNLGNTLRQLKRYDEAELSYKKTIDLKPNYAAAHNNLGMTLRLLGRLKDAERRYKKAIKLKPEYALAYNNLGNVLKDLGGLDEAETSYRKAIDLKPDYAAAFSNLGMVLKDRRDFLGALENSKKAIEIDPKLSISHLNMAIIFYVSGDIDSALGSLKKANSIDPRSKDISLLLSIFQGRKSKEKAKVDSNGLSDLNFNKLIANPLILNREVESELVASLYDMNSRELDKTKDARYGNGRCSVDFSMLEDKNPIIKTITDDLTSIMSKAVKSEVFILDSFFNILKSGGGSTPHSHVQNFDEDQDLDLLIQKYSLVYYLAVGDQNCSEPGILKLYDPSEDILPSPGMIVIIPGNREHSAVYNGMKDTVMIGINFYSL